MDQGFKHIRLQYAGYGATESTGNNVPRPGIHSSDGPTTHDGIYDPVGYLIDTPKMFAYAREVSHVSRHACVVHEFRMI